MTRKNFTRRFCIEDPRGKPKSFLKKRTGKAHANERQEEHIGLKAIICDETQMIKRTQSRDKHACCSKNISPV